MIDTFSSAALAWLLTYLIHSTVLLALAWGLTRARSWSPASADLVWKTALIGGMLTATVQLRLELRPAGTLSLAHPSSTVPAILPTSHAPRVSAVTRSDAGEISMESSSHTGVASRVEAAPSSAAASIPSMQTTAAVIWAVGALALALGYAARRLILVGRIGDRRAVSDGRLLAELERLSREAKLGRRPRLTVTARISSPIALGIAEICLPESALEELDLEEQRVMLAHELAHLARRDPLWLAFASVVERVLWFQPLNRLARRRIAASAEYLCDEWAVRRTGSSVALARCLAQVAEWIQTSPLGVPVAGMAEERSLLVSRVEKLLAGARHDSRSRGAIAVASVAVVLATIAVVPGVTGRAAGATEPYGMPDEPKPSHEAAASRPTIGTQAANPAEVELTSSAPARPAPANADTAVVFALIGRLKDEDADVRAAAAESLGKLEDSRAVPGLIAALSDREAKVRAAAAGSLAKFTDARALAPLSALLTDPETDVRKQALDALTEYETGVPAANIVRLLADPDADLRHSAAHALGHFGDRSAGAALAGLVRDPSADVRQAAIESLADLHDVSHTSAIVAALGDANADVRRQALEALDNLKAPVPDATLLVLLRDGDADVRAKAAEFAGQRSSVAAIPSLRRLMDDENRDVRETAVEALANIGDEAAVAALRAGLASKDAKVRRASAEALGDRRP
jgi:HEAT repeat protein/beta-lactamase regulating signal transducer with metallopeptidase domain